MSVQRRVLKTFSVLSVRQPWVVPEASVLVELVD
jgi:hypothetical protein